MKPNDIPMKQVKRNGQKEFQTIKKNYGTFKGESSESPSMFTFWSAIPSASKSSVLLWLHMSVVSICFFPII